jgi:hypothetical protein
MESMLRKARNTVMRAIYSRWASISSSLLWEWACACKFFESDPCLSYEPIWIHMIKLVYPHAY